jgi:hypothetical protein
MRTEHLPLKTLFAGILGMAMGGCSSTDTVDTTGAEASGGTASGGAIASGTTGGTTTQPGVGGKTSTGGTTAQPGAGGESSTGGTTAQPVTGGTTSEGGSESTGGTPDNGAGAGGDTASGGGPGGASSGGAAAGGMTGSGGEATGGSPDTGTCTASEATGRNVSGSGPHEVVMETNSESGIACGTIYRPADLAGEEKYPILVWGEGGCSQDGLSNQAALGEIASWGYFIIADGTPGGTGACAGGQDGAAFLDYSTWAIAENGKSCSAYFQSLDTTKIAADGFSCGGLMSENVSGDPRFSAIGITSSGLFAPDAGLYDAMHAPFKIMNGGSGDMAYENGLTDYKEISSRGIPIVYFSKTSAGHGGDLDQARGDFNLVNLAWLNWRLKGDEGATGKGFLYGSTCKVCTDSGWVYQSANIE